jgi:hypothetical protein
MRSAALSDDSWIRVDNVAGLVLLATDAVDDVLLLRHRQVLAVVRVERAQDVSLKINSCDILRGLSKQVKSLS